MPVRGTLTGKPPYPFLEDMKLIQSLSISKYVLHRYFLLLLTCIEHRKSGEMEEDDYVWE